MGSKKELVCWEESQIKKWEMIKVKDSNNFLLNLLQNYNVDRHTIFIIPCNGLVSGIWLWKETHKNSRVDFWNFFEEYGSRRYQSPEKEENKEILHELHERNGNDTKYGWISPDGRYFHCGYQGHTALADNICFGMVETDNAEYYLEEHGWCKIYKSLFADKYSVYIGGKYVINDEQIQALIKLGLENAEDLSKMLCKDR